MLQTSPSRCLRAAPAFLSFTSSNQSVMIRVTYAAQRQSIPTSTRKLSTRVLRVPQTCVRQQQQQQSQRPVTAVEYCLSKCTRPSTTSFTRTNTTDAAPAASPTLSSSTTSLTWNRYLALRKTRKRISIICSIVTAVCTTAIGAQYLSQTDFDQWAAKATGMDPMIVLGLSTFGLFGAGWFLGSILGTPVFNARYRVVLPEFRAKESDFFKRIQRNRADVSNASIQNPPPDYYGEKIRSVSGYRTWLRDQRAYRLKRGGSV